MLIVDSVTKVSKRLLAVPGEQVQGLELSPDARELYAVFTNPQADIVLAKLGTK